MIERFNATVYDISAILICINNIQDTKENRLKQFSYVTIMQDPCRQYVWTSKHDKFITLYVIFNFFKNRY